VTSRVGDAGAVSRMGDTGDHMLLEGKRLLITGVLTDGSIAWHTAKMAQEQGAEVVLTGFGRGMRLTERAGQRLPSAPEVYELDINDPSHMEALVAALDDRWGGIDGALHAIAFAPDDALGGNFLSAPAASAQTAFTTSAFSYKALTHGLLPLFQAAGGGAVVALDFDSSTMAWPAYDWMGVSKAALASVTRYLATYLGPEGIRANAVAAGPLATVAAKSIAGFSLFQDVWDERSPLRWDVHDPTPVARMACVLLSDWAPMTTGEVIHVDGGFHAGAASIRRLEEVKARSEDLDSPAE
jgi:enoyl-[acyl-carrier protein] reductase I